MNKSQNTMGIDTEQSQSNTGTNANQNDNSNYFKRDAIANTPFEIIEEEGKGVYVVMGNYRLTELLKTRKEVQKAMNTWNFKVNVITAIMEIRDVVKEVKEHQTKN